MSEPSRPKLPKPRTIAEEGLVLDYSFGAGGLQSRSELAALVMAYIGYVSELDFKLECATLVAIGGGQRVAEAFLAGMTPLEYGHRRSAVQGILKTKAGLSVKEVDALFSGIKDARDLRNDFAHGLWWEHGEVPDTLILSRTYNELRRFGVALDTVRSEPARRAIMEFVIGVTSGGGELPSGFGEKLSKLTAQLRSPWDLAFSEQAQAASEKEKAERTEWFSQNPSQNIDWSRLTRSDERPTTAKSELLAMGSGVHSDATIWNADLLTQAIIYARYMRDKAQALIDRLQRVGE